MSNKFEHWEKLFKENKIQEFKKENSDAIKWLKIKSISRKELLYDLIKTTKLPIEPKGKKSMNCLKKYMRLILKLNILIIF